MKLFYFESGPSGNGTWQSLLTAVDPTVRGGSVLYTNLTEDSLVAHLTGDDHVYDGLKMVGGFDVSWLDHKTTGFMAKLQRFHG